MTAPPPDERTGPEWKPWRQFCGIPEPPVTVECPFRPGSMEARGFENIIKGMVGLTDAYDRRYVDHVVRTSYVEREGVMNKVEVKNSPSTNVGKAGDVLAIGEVGIVVSCGYSPKSLIVGGPVVRGPCSQVYLGQGRFDNPGVDVTVRRLFPGEQVVITGQ